MIVNEKKKYADKLKMMGKLVYGANDNMQKNTAPPTYCWLTKPLFNF